MKNRIYSRIFAGALVLALVAAAAYPISAAVVKPVKKSISSGKLPKKWQEVEPEKRLAALRVAQLDAYRGLSERIYGFQLDGGTSVYDFMLESDIIRNSIHELLKGATETEAPEYTEDGIVQVVYGVALQEVIEVIKSNMDSIKNPGLKKKKEIIVKKFDGERRLVEALGNGAIPGSKGMDMIRAKRAAEQDAYRKMAERFVGIKIDSDTTVKDFCLQNDALKSSATAFLKGLKPVSIEYLEDGSCQVTMQLKIREIVETIESFVKIQKGDETKITEKTLRKVNRDFNDRTYKVVGMGAPGSCPASMPSNVNEAVSSGIQEDEVILRQVISTKIITE